MLACGLATHFVPEAVGFLCNFFYSVISDTEYRSSAPMNVYIFNDEL